MTTEKCIQNTCGMTAEPPYMFSEKLRRLLDTRIGAFNLYDHYIAYLVTYQVYINRDLKSGEFDSDVVSKLLGKAKLYLKYVFRVNKNIKKTDILFISRYREHRPGNGEKDKKRDYMFYNVLKNVRSGCNVALASVEFNEKRYDHPESSNYNLYDFFSLSVILRAIYRTLHVYFRYRLFTIASGGAEKGLRKDAFSLLNILSWCMYGYSLDSMFRRLAPKVVVANDDTMLRVKPADYRNKLIVTQSGLLVEVVEKFRSGLYSQFNIDDRKSDAFLVSGEYFYAIKDRFNADTKKISVIGQPRFDCLFDESYIKSLTDKTKGAEKVILWSTQSQDYLPEEGAAYIEEIRGLLKDIPGIRLIIKLHPGESHEGGLYKKLVDEFDNVEVCKADASLYGLIYISDIFISKNSTSIIEAAILKKKIICMDFRGVNYIDFAGQGAGKGVYKRGELKDAVLNMLSDDGRHDGITDDFIRKFNGFDDGQASIRVAAIAAQML